MAAVMRMQSLQMTGIGRLLMGGVLVSMTTTPATCRVLTRATVVGFVVWQAFNATGRRPATWLKKSAKNCYKFADGKPEGGGRKTKTEKPVSPPPVLL